MEISEKEYYELQRQVRTLQSQVDAMNGPKKVTSLRDLVEEQVISGVKNLEDDRPIFGYSHFNSDAWAQFLALSKMLHEPSPLFYMGRAYSSDQWHIKPYIRWINPKNGPKKIADLTPEQARVSVQMLDELIPIYNRYFKLMHQRVLYDPTGKGEYEPYGVVDEQEVQSEVEFE